MQIRRTGCEAAAAKNTLAGQGGKYFYDPGEGGGPRLTSGGYDSAAVAGGAGNKLKYENAARENKRNEGGKVFTLFPLISRYFILFPPVFYFLRRIDEC